MAEEKEEKKKAKFLVDVVEMAEQLDAALRMQEELMIVAPSFPFGFHEHEVLSEHWETVRQNFLDEFYKVDLLYN